MKAQLSNYYRKQGGLMVFVYLVIGTIIELAKYKETQGTNYRENEKGEPLFFSSRALSTNRTEKVDLTITTNGRVVADDLNKILNQEAKLDDYVLQEKAKLMASIALGSGGVDHLTDLTSSRTIATPAEVEEVIAAAVVVGEALPV